MSDSSDSDSSDIENLFKKAASQTKRQATQDGVDSDDDDDDDSVQVVSTFHHNKKQKMSVEEKLAAIEQKKAIRDRQRRASKQAVHLDSDEDEDEDEDSPKRKVQVEIEVDGAENDSKKQATVNLLDDDSSDDEEEAPRKSVSITDLQKQGADQQTLQELQRAQQSIQLLQQAQRYRAEDVSVQAMAAPALGVAGNNNCLYAPGLGAAAAGLNGNGLAGGGFSSVPQMAAVSALGGLSTANLNQAALLALAQQQQQGPGRQLLFVVRARLERIGGTAADALTKNLTLMLYENETLEVLENKFLQEFGLNRSVATTMLRFNGQPLLPNHTPAQYGLENQSVIDATALLSGFRDVSATAAPKVDIGAPLKLTLRRQEGKNVQQDTLQTGTKESFRGLVDKYRAAKNLGPNVLIVLKFDGENLRMDETPVAFDMEDEDLIDVYVQ